MKHRFEIQNHEFHRGISSNTLDVNSITLCRNCFQPIQSQCHNQELQYQFVTSPSIILNTKWVVMNSILSNLSQRRPLLEFQINLSLPQVS